MNCKVVLLAAGAGTVARPEHRLVGLGAGCSWSQSAQMFSLNPLIQSQSAVTSLWMVKNSVGSAFTSSCWSCFFSSTQKGVTGGWPYFLFSCTSSRFWAFEAPILVRHIFAALHFSGLEAHKPSIGHDGVDFIRFQRREHTKIHGTLVTETYINSSFLLQWQYFSMWTWCVETAFPESAKEDNHTGS